MKNADVPVEKVAPSEKLINALADDLNTPLALSYLHETLSNLNKAETIEERSKYKSELLANAYMLGLLYNDAESWFKGADDDNSEIETLIAKRAEAKKNKDWATADAIRNELKEKGIVLEDGPNGTTWKKI